MTTLITGAGMIGSLAAARIVSERGERPVLYDIAFSERNLAERLDSGSVDLVKGDIGDIGDLLRTIETHGVERIIHTASLLTRDLIPRPVAGVRVNVMGTLNVLESARMAGLARVVFCGSTVVTMGRRSVAPEDDTLEDFTLKVVSEYPPSLYASMKLASEWLCHNYADSYGLDTAVVRFGGAFGPWHGVPGGGPSKLLKQLIECAHFGRTYRIAQADLHRQGMDYTYSPDGAQGLVRAAFAPEAPNRVYNATMGRDVHHRGDHRAHRAGRGPPDRPGDHSGGLDDQVRQHDQSHGPDRVAPRSRLPGGVPDGCRRGRLPGLAVGPGVRRVLLSGPGAAGRQRHSGRHR